MVVGLVPHVVDVIYGADPFVNTRSLRMVLEVQRLTGQLRFLLNVAQHRQYSTVRSFLSSSFVVNVTF